MRQLSCAEISVVTGGMTENEMLDKTFLYGIGLGILSGGCIGGLRFQAFLGAFAGAVIGGATGAFGGLIAGPIVVFCAWCSGYKFQS